MIGANDDPDSYGGRFWRFSAMSTGVTRYAVNRRAGAISDAPCVRTLRELPEAPELVVIATPTATVEALIDECLDVGVCAAIVLARIHPELRDAIRERCAGRLSLLGGSSLGLVDANHGIVLSSSVSLSLSLRGGPLGLVSQSGAVMGVLHARALRQGIGLGMCISTGEQVGVRTENVLCDLAGDDRLQAVGVYLEDVEPESFAEAARLLHSAGLRLVALKGGTSAHGATATATHSGALVSDGRAFKALARDLGVVLATDPEELLNCMHATLFEGRRFFVGTLSGGFAAVAADLAVASGVALAGPSLEVPAAGGLKGESLIVGNPTDIDALAADDAEAADLIARLATDPRGDGLILVISDRPHLELLLDRIGKLDADALSRVQVCSECSGQYEPVLSDHCSETLGFVRGIHQCLRAVACTRPEHVSLTFSDLSPRLAMDEDEIDGTVLLDGPATWTLLAGAGVPAVPLREVRCKDDLDLLLAGEQSIVFKRDGVAHRRHDEVIVVQDRESAAAAYDKLAAKGRVIAQAQSEPGLEFFVGITRDQVFGLLFLIGAGGPLIETLGDISVHVGLPHRNRIRELLDETSVGQWLRSSIGHDLVDTEALCGLADELCQMVHQMPEIASLDANPIIVYPRGAAVLDAKVRLIKRPEGESDGYGQDRSPSRRRRAHHAE